MRVLPRCGSVLNRGWFLVPADPTTAGRLEPELGDLADLYPVPRRDFLDEARVIGEVGDLIADVLDAAADAGLALRLVEVDGVFAVGFPNREDAVGQLHDLGDVEKRAGVVAALGLVILDALNELFPCH